jgi:hypothetical protein
MIDASDRRVALVGADGRLGRSLFGAAFCTESVQNAVLNSDHHGSG